MDGDFERLRPFVDDSLEDRGDSTASFSSVMTAQPHESLTQAEFPAWEARQLAKHEFVCGHVYAFAGGTVEHNRLASLLLRAVAPAADPCDTYGSDMLIEMTNSSRYADVVVTCDERDRVRGAMIIRHPKLIVEILSASTASDDCGPKMREYQAIETLREYLMVDSRKRWAQAAHRAGSRWHLEPPLERGVLGLRSLELAIDLDDLYRRAGVDP